MPVVRLNLTGEDVLIAGAIAITHQDDCGCFTCMVSRAATEASQKAEHAIAHNDTHVGGTSTPIRAVTTAPSRDNYNDSPCPGCKHGNYGAGAEHSCGVW